MEQVVQRRSDPMEPSAPSASSPGGELLKVEGLGVEFATEDGGVKVLSGLSLQVQRGEILAIVGESGSGKSVTALSIMGLLSSNAQVGAGRVEFDGVDLLRLSEPEMRKLRGGRIGMIFQDPMTALNPVMTIGAQLTESLEIHRKLDRAAAEARAVELLGLVGIPDPKSRLGQYPHQFSGGMRQRVMIAIGLSCDPQLLIADEPTTALDVTIQAQILELMQGLCKRLGVALIVITHNLGVVARYADRVMIMYAGRLMEEGRADQVFANPRHLYTAGLLASVPRLSGDPDARLAAIEGLPPNPKSVPPGCAFAPRCPHSLPACATAGAQYETDVGTISTCVRVTDIAAGKIAWAHPASVPATAAQPATVAQPAAPKAGAATTEHVIRVENLEKTYTVKAGWLGKRAHIRAVRDVSFAIGRQETLGLVGESGCGKSTLGKLLLRLEEPTSGRILFGDQDITHASDRALRPFRRHTQVVFQDPFASLNPHQRIGDIIAEPVRVHGIAKNAREAKETAERLMLDVGLRTDLMTRYPHQLSGGQRQRVGIARALAMEPSFIVCDEAVSALDVSIQAQVVNLLSDLQSKLRLSYLFIGHDLAVVRQIATRVMVMYLGRVVEVADRDEFYNNPQHPYAQLLMAAAPSPDPEREKKYRTVPIHGEPPSPANPPSGCAFRTRCPVVMPQCAEVVPPLVETSPGHHVACLRCA